MRSRAFTFGLSLTIGILALASFDTAWSQPGSVMSHQKISDIEGNFTADIADFDEFGGSVASLGDLDGAGPSVAALAVGVIGDDDGGGNRGCVYILFLNGAGGVLSYQKISDTEGNFTAVLDNIDEFGSSVASLGDLDGAGPSVLALAVGTAADDDGGTNRGAVYILFLNSAGSVLTHQKISDLEGNFTAIIDSGDEFGGGVVGLGDLDGAGPSAGAVAVATVGDDDGGLSRGAVYILFLNSNGTVRSFEKISDTAGNFSAVLENADEFGSSIGTLGDLDGAGPSVATLAVGVIGDDDGGADRGAVYVLFLNSAGQILSHSKISATQGNFTGTLENLDEFGGSVAGLGDLDGPGPAVAALAVGTIGDDDGGSGRGATYVVFLDSAGSTLSHLKISDTASNFTGTLDDGDEFGTCVAALGDLDGPGGGTSAQVLVIGASFDDDGGEDRGGVWGVFLEGGVPTDAGDPLPRAPLHVLELARPNPFNPRTTIPFQVGETAMVEIDIRDVRGHLVRKLALGTLGAGRHAATFDGLDDTGRPLASGSYFYRMLVNGQMVGSSEKAVLLK